MRLERLTLAPYGRFADRALDFRAGAPLHVVYGTNESGKTTTLSAIGDLLYGFPGQTPYGFRHDQRALRVGGLFRLADGSALELRRRKGNKNTLVDSADQPIVDEALRRALGGVDRKTFETEFGLTAEALRAGGAALLAAGGGFAETLAASSANLSALARLKEMLSEQADELFTPRKSAQKKFYLALERHDEADRRLRDAIVTSDALKHAQADALAARAREIDLKAQHQETGRALAKLQRAQRTSGKLGRLADLERELADLADLPEIDAASLEAWRKAFDEDKALQGELAELGADEATEEAAASELRVDEALLAQGSAIEALRERLGAVRKAAEDRPRRIEAHNIALAALEDLARRLGLPDHAALLAAPPSDPEMARAKALIEQRKLAERRHGEALARREEALAEQRRLARVAGAAAPDPEPFQRKLDPLEGSLADADRLRRERAGLEADARALEEEAARLDPSPGGLDALARLALPDPETIARHLRREGDLAEARRAAEKKLGEAGRALGAGEAALARREVEAGKTRADWVAARELRDIGLNRLEDALDGDTASRRECFDAALSLVGAADAIADAVISDSERAARLQAAREDVAARREDLARAQAEAESLQGAAAEAQAEWRAAWAPSGVAPHSPADMARWRERAGALLARRAEIARRRAEISALESGLTQAQAALAQALAERGLTAAPSFELGYREARAHLEAMRKAWMQSREIGIARDRADKDAAEAEAALTREARALEAIVAGWPEAMAGLRLAAGASMVEAEAALEVWRNVALPRQNMTQEARRIDGIERDLASFESGVAAVAAAAAPALAGARADEALAQLTATLAEARRAADARASLDRSIAQRAVRKRGLQARREGLHPRLAEASARLAAVDAAALALALERLQQRRGLEAERAALRRDLSEIADGLDEAALRTEQAELDFTLLPGQIDLTGRRQSELLQEITEAARAARDAEARLEALGRGRDAAGAAHDRIEARAELVDIGERWLLRQAAAKLAARAIERHRAAAQDPLIERASELFRLATGESFASLGADYDSADHPVLAAIREGGERVRVEGLSEGARDQLFLALRLALLERRAGEPLPFVGDDILASFDDARTRCTLSLLAEFGKARQVILFTHHRHVADLAREAGAEVVEM